MAELKLIANGKFYNRYMNEGAKLADEQQTVPCRVCSNEDVKYGTDGMIIESPTVTVEIAENTDVKWTDEYGNAHTDHLINGEKMKFDKKFINV